MSSFAPKFVTAIALSVGLMSLTFAQTAFRCDNNGQTVYSDKPCPAGKTVGGTQDSAEQKAAAKAANAQMLQDNNDLNKRLSDRQKLEAQERADVRKATGKPVLATAKGNANGKFTKAKATKKLKTAKQRNKKKTRDDPSVLVAK